VNIALYSALFITIVNNVFIGDGCYKIVKEEKPMGKNPLKRSLIVGIIFLFLSTTCMPVLASEELPDLIIELIGFAPTGDGQLDDIAFATIRNIGSVKAIGSIEVKFTFIRMLFGIIPIKIAQTDTHSITVGGGLQPQDFAIVDLIYEDELPKFGIFELRCSVNPGRTIEESNYDNNELSQKFIAFFGQWN
jgi:hypothetical protein